MATRPGRSTNGWRRDTWAFFEQVRAVIDNLRNYWPLTLRQIYYQLVAAEVIENTIGAYRKVSGLLVAARLDDMVPWDAMEDRSRSMLISAGWSDQAAFVADEREKFLDGYRRDLLQSQDKALELWVEKDALSRVCHDVALPYCVPVIVARGFSSVSYVNDCKQRIEANTADGKATVILYFGDMDPSGWSMLDSMMVTLQDDMGLGDQVVPRRCALTPEIIDLHNLPHDPTALKANDPRAEKYVAQFGELAVELDALPPATLQAIIRRSIEAELNMFIFEVEQAVEAEEREALADLRLVVGDFMDGL